MRILVIDDDFICRTVLARFLQSFGEVVGAADGRAGLDQFAQAAQAGRPFDLVALDLMMPGMDGHEVLKHLRAAEVDREDAGRTTKVLMTTALGDLTNVRTAYQGLCDEYLTKPIRKATLFEAVQKLGFPLPK